MKNLREKPLKKHNKWPLKVLIMNILWNRQGALKLSLRLWVAQHLTKTLNVAFPFNLWHICISDLSSPRLKKKEKVTWFREVTHNVESSLLCLSRSFKYSCSYSDQNSCVRAGSSGDSQVRWRVCSWFLNNCHQFL